MMKTFAKILALGVALAAAAPMAKADPITGGFTLTGSSDNDTTFNGSGGQIQFNTSPYTNSTGTGSYSQLGPGTSLNFVNVFTYSGISAPGGEQLFTFTFSGSTFTTTSTFFVTGASESNGTITLTGYVVVTSTGTGGASGTATASYTMYNIYGSGPNAGQDDNMLGSGPFDGTFTITPEPNSLLLLGTGLVGAAGVLFRKRRRNTIT